MRLKISQFLLSLVIISALMLGGCSTQQVGSNTSSPTSTATSDTNESSTQTTTEATSVSQINSDIPGITDLPRLEGKATVVLTVKGSPITIEVD
ncbi:MAG: peptidylprolyl isomerase, partial [Nostoc sp. C3-bin3]|nr:peptidylprolyl isomerase [Nostoc sp. C3-bin3]